MNTIKEINLIPIPENEWWRGKEKTITHLPIVNWELEYTPPEIEKDKWLRGSINNDFIGWPWWKIEDTNVHLFLNVPLRLVGVEEGEVESDEVLTFILNTLGKEDEYIKFIPTLGKEWEEEIIPEKYICNSNNRRFILPGMVLVSTYFSPPYKDNKSAEEIKNNIEIKEKLEEFLLKDDGTHILKYKGKEILKYDCRVENEYGWFKSRIGIEEKNSTTSTKFAMVKKMSLINSLIQDKRKEWINLTKSLLKK